ncbi:hypothetical protein [Planctobacterium marinum]|uniref:hypothetical protein n=1 Tax=Planctobacterium marinum TaxID=1631968 RepID=UPI001E51B7BA|nr:hypothetical protein [Planctobacterium marinum]MCC2604262.1 hypothetical protein [Planctobacterium marinum]
MNRPRGDQISHHRTYETSSDRRDNANRTHGQQRTRSGSIEIRRRSGSVDHFHYHENRNTTGFMVSRGTHTDRHGTVTHGRRNVDSSYNP